MKKTYLIAGIILVLSIGIVTGFEMRDNWKMYHGKAYLVAKFSSPQRDFEMYQLDSGHTVLCAEDETGVFGLKSDTGKLTSIISTKSWPGSLPNKSNLQLYRATTKVLTGKMLSG
jgi:hypothetical protein